MSRIVPARRMPNAGFAARILRRLRPVILKTVVLLLIAAIGFPLQFGPPAEARPNSTIAPPPPAAPPEAFVVQQAETRAVARVLTTASTLAELVGGIGDALSQPSPPAGFEAARFPTVTERLTSHIQPILSLIAPTKS